MLQAIICLSYHLFELPSVRPVCPTSGHESHLDWFSDGINPLRLVCHLTSIKLEREALRPLVNRRKTYMIYCCSVIAPSTWLHLVCVLPTLSCLLPLAPLPATQSLKEGTRRRCLCLWKLWVTAGKATHKLSSTLSTYFNGVVHSNTSVSTVTVGTCLLQCIVLLSIVCVLSHKFSEARVINITGTQVLH